MDIASTAFAASNLVAAPASWYNVNRSTNTAGQRWLERRDLCGALSSQGVLCFRLQRIQASSARIAATQATELCPWIITSSCSGVCEE
jgi:hypothetical protein